MQQAFPRKYLIDNEWTCGEKLSESKMYQDEKCMEKLIAILASGNASHALQVLYRVIDKNPVLKSSFVDLVEKKESSIDSEIVDSVKAFMKSVSKPDATQADREASYAVMTACTYNSKIPIRTVCQQYALTFFAYHFIIIINFKEHYS